MKNRVAVLLSALLILATGGCVAEENPPVTEVSDPPTAETPTADPTVAASDPSTAAPSETAEPTEVAEQSEEPPANGGEAAKKFFEALASPNLKDTRRMLSLAAPGSPAEDYAVVQIALAEAEQQSGGGVEEFVEVSPKGVQLCQFGEERQCIHFVDIAVQDGKIFSWANDGSPLIGRIAGEQPIGNAFGADVTMKAAFYSVTGDALFVALEIHNRSDNTVSPGHYSAEYVAKDGKQVSAQDASGPTELRAGAKANYIVLFPEAKMGGTMYLPVSGPNFNGEKELSVKVQADG